MNRLALLGVLVFMGIGWGAMVSLPFAIVSQQVSQSSMGLFMGLFNLSVVLPQLVVSLGVALVISRAEDLEDADAVSAAIGATNINTIVGPVNWGAGPVPNVL